MHTEATFQARVGQIIGAKYRLLRLIGAGGMGAVYEAENTWIKRRVAIKVLRPDLTRNQDAVQRFTQEAQAATQIEHPNIVFVLDMGQEPTDGALYIVQEFLTGTDLRRRLAADGKLGVGDSIATMLPIMNALVAAHERGIVHRDLKPENVFLSRLPNGEVVPKLIDFGVSKIMDSAGSLTKTQAGMALGTPYYMSPEQGRGDLDVDARTDVWAIGVVFFELLAGNPPFDGPNHNILVLKILTERAPRLDTVASHVPADLASLVAAALEPDRERRIPTMRVFRDALLQFAASHPELGIVSPTSTPAPGAISIAVPPAPAVAARVPAPATAIHGTFGALAGSVASPGSAASPSASFGATLPLGAAAVAGTPGAPLPPSAVRSPTLPLASGVAGAVPPQAPPPGLQATSLGWTAGPHPATAPAKTPWLLFMAIAALSVFVGAAGVALIKRGRHARTAASTAPPVTRLSISPNVADAGQPAPAQPSSSALAPHPNAASPAIPTPVPPSPLPTAATAPSAPTAPTAPTSSPARNASRRTAHGVPQRATPNAPIVQPQPSPAMIPPPAPVAAAPPPVAPQAVAPAPVPPPRRVAPTPADPLVQRANTLVSQLQYASQQLADSDPRRAQQLTEDAGRIQYEAEQIRAMEQQIRELQSVDPGTAQQLRSATDRQRTRLQRMMSRFAN